MSALALDARLLLKVADASREPRRHHASRAGGDDASDEFRSNGTDRESWLMVRCRGGVVAASRNLTQITSGPDEDKPGVGRERVRREERSGRSKWVLSRMASMVDRGAENAA